MVTLFLPPECTRAGTEKEEGGMGTRPQASFSPGKAADSRRNIKPSMKGLSSLL